MVGPEGKLSEDELKSLVTILFAAEAALEEIKNVDDRDVRDLAMKKVEGTMTPNRYQVNWHGVLALKYGTDLILSGKFIDDHVYPEIHRHLKQARAELTANAQMKTWFQEVLEHIRKNSY